MRRAVVLIALLVAVTVALAAPAAGARHHHPTLSLPFKPGQTWFICQGYNTSEIDHDNAHNQANALDLSIDPNSFSTANGAYGCTGDQNASQGLPVTAPASGTVLYNFAPDMVCMHFDGGGSAAIGHMSGMATIGTHVAAGDPIGTVKPATPGNQGNYAHIHIAAYKSNNCSGNTIPFDDAHHTRFLCAPDLPSDGSAHQYYRKYLSQCGTTSSSSTTSARLRVEVMLEGISPEGADNHTPLHPQRPVTVDVFNTNWKLVASKTDSATYDSTSGAFATTIDLGSTWKSGNYFVKVRLPNTLRQTMGRYSGSTFSIAPGQITYLPRTPLFTGDINDDNILNILDYNILLNCLGNTGCSSAEHTASDLNDDGVLSSGADYNIWLRDSNGASKNCSKGTCVYNHVWSFLF